MAYTIIDFETTGLDYLTEQVIEIGAVKYDNNFNEVGRLHTMVQLTEGRKLPQFIKDLTGITEQDTYTGVPEAVGLNMLKDFIGKSIVVAQHAPFDLSFLAKAVEPEQFIDTRSLSRLIDPDKKAGLKDLCERYGVKLENHHRSINDVEATAQVLQIMLEEARALGLPVTNIVVKSPDRDLNFIPLSAMVIPLEDVQKFHNKLEEVDEPTKASE
jgi:DNA polymerase III subunit epsilon